MINTNSENSFIAEEKEVTTTACFNPIADSVKNIAMNNMQIIEVKSYLLKDKIKKLKGKHSFKGYTLNEITVLSFSSIKEGYLTVNGNIDIPLTRLRIDSTEDEGPWYYTNKDEAVVAVRDFNKIEWEAIREIKAEADAADEYHRNLYENDRF